MSNKFQVEIKMFLMKQLVVSYKIFLCGIKLLTCIFEMSNNSKIQATMRYLSNFSVTYFFRRISKTISPTIFKYIEKMLLVKLHTKKILVIKLGQLYSFLKYVISNLQVTNVICLRYDAFNAILFKSLLLPLKKG